MILTKILHVLQEILPNVFCNNLKIIIFVFSNDKISNKYMSYKLFFF